MAGHHRARCICVSSVKSCSRLKSPSAADPGVDGRGVGARSAMGLGEGYRSRCWCVIDL